MWEQNYGFFEEQFILTRGENYFFIQEMHPCKIKFKEQKDNPYYF